MDKVSQISRTCFQKEFVKISLQIRLVKIQVCLDKVTKSSIANYDIKSNKESPLFFKHFF